MNRILSILSVLSCFFLLFSFSTEAVSQNQNYYVEQMEQNGIPAVTGKSLDTLAEISTALRQYLKKGNEEPSLLIFPKAKSITWSMSMHYLN